MRPALALLLLSFVAFAPQLLFAEWRGTEARRVEIAREMLESGNWMVPTIGNQPTLAKPPLYYWTLAALQNFGRDPLLMRLPSVLAFWLLALVCYYPLRRHYSERSAWIGAAGILLSPMALDHVPYAEIDPLFSALTAISIVWLAEGASFRSRWRLVAAGLIGGLALLTKGPPYLLFLVGSMLVWLRRLRLEGAQWFFPALLVLPLAYFVPLVTSEVGLQRLLDVAERESFGRVNFFTLGHILETPWYFVRAVVAVLPLGLWAFHEYRGDREMRDTTVLGREETFLRISAGAMVGAVILLTFFPARPGRYLLPGVPCFLIALGPAVAAYTRFASAPSLLLGPLMRVLGVLGCVGVMATPWLPFPFDGATPLFFLALAVAPLVARARLGVVVYAFVIPLIAAWTVLPDRARRLAVPPYSEVVAAETLQAELSALGARDVGTWGHVSAEVLLASDEIRPGDEAGRQRPTNPWLILELRTRDRDPGTVAGYVDRLRLCLAGKTLVLKQRE